MIASFSVYPLGQGTSLGRFVKKGVSVVENSGYTYEVGGMATTVEVPDLDALFELVKKVHAAHVAEGAQRVVIDLKVDDRRDKAATIASKKKSVIGG
ncbi:MAG: MTH1187 family thiamine-binding protein [Pseudomonadota bacterium]